MKLKPLREYSLWLEPENINLKHINFVVNKIQNKTKSIRFKPHVTLLGGLDEKESELINRIKSFSKEKSFFIHFKKLSLGNDEFKTVFLECKKVKNLYKLNQLSQKIFRTTKPFHPHMSIVYGNFNKKQKALINSELKKYKLSYFSFEVKNISFGKHMELQISGKE